MQFLYFYHYRFWFGFLNKAGTYTLQSRALTLNMLNCFNITLIFFYFSVVVDSGPRYEVAYPNGICHFLEKLSFGVSLEILFIL